jgi:hypothetical protein
MESERGRLRPPIAQLRRRLFESFEPMSAGRVANKRFIECQVIGR